MEEHWDNWIVEDDWKWFSEHGINTVRIPVLFNWLSTPNISQMEKLQIGFYHVYGLNTSVVTGTDFAHVGEVFSGAWIRIQKAIDTAERYGIGVLIGIMILYKTFFLFL